MKKDDVLHLGKLANLNLSEEEIKKYLEQLEKTLEYVKNLDQLNTDNVITTKHNTKSTNTFFKDGEENKRSLNQEEALKNSKNKKDGYFVVKRIM